MSTTWAPTSWAASRHGEARSVVLLRWPHDRVASSEKWSLAVVAPAWPLTRLAAGVSRAQTRDPGRPASACGCWSLIRWGEGECLQGYWVWARGTWAEHRTGPVSAQRFAREPRQGRVTEGQPLTAGGFQCEGGYRVIPGAGALPSLPTEGLQAALAHVPRKPLLTSLLVAPGALLCML